MPRITVSEINNAATVKKLRQNVTSKDRADSRWRVITPAVLHKRVTKTIRDTARACDIEALGMGTEVSRKAGRQSESIPGFMVVPA